MLSKEHKEIVRKNRENGYIHVATFDGFDLYKKKTEPGGWAYYSDECGPFFVVYDTTVNSNEVLEAIYLDNELRNK